MFPNFRLMIAAVAASVVALSCGFGVFAALRVNHEPLARLPPATAPLQLAPDKVAAPALLSARPSPVGEPEIAAAAPDVRRARARATRAIKLRPPLRPPSRKLSHPLRKRRRRPRRSRQTRR
jgi:hypothetical protein